MPSPIKGGGESRLEAPINTGVGVFGGVYDRSVCSDTGVIDSATIESITLLEDLATQRGPVRNDIKQSTSREPPSHGPLQ